MFLFTSHSCTYHSSRSNLKMLAPSYSSSPRSTETCYRHLLRKPTLSFKVFIASRAQALQLRSQKVLTKALHHPILEKIRNLRGKIVNKTIWQSKSQIRWFQKIRVAILVLWTPYRVYFRSEDQARLHKNLLRRKNRRKKMSMYENLIDSLFRETNLPSVKVQLTNPCTQIIQAYRISQSSQHLT